MRRTLVVVVCLLALSGIGRADPPAFALSLTGPSSYLNNVPVTFSGVLTAAGVGLPMQPVQLYVDGVAAGTGTTALDGTYSIAHTFTLTAPYFHIVKAVANDGGLLQTSSPDHAVSPPPAPALVINEVDYDQLGSDIHEFVEIYNPAPDPADLTGVVLVLANGATNSEYRRVVLSGTLPGYGYALVKQPPVPSGLATLVFGFDVQSNAIQNGAPDGLALIYLPTETLIDALSYEGAMGPTSINGSSLWWNLVEGGPASAVDVDTIPGSLSRTPNGTDTNNAASDWGFMPATPGAANP